MTALRVLAASLLAAGILTGTLADAPLVQPPLVLGGYRVLATDFHIHAYPLNGSTLAPWDLVIEARRQGLDAIAMTPQNHISDGYWARRFSQFVGGPAVVIGEEIHGPRYHMIAAGIHQTVSWRNTALESIEDIHRQGGVAIAAHPIAAAWSAYDSEALRKLDAAEIMQPVVYNHPEGAGDLRTFFQRGRFAAIGSSDYHGMGPLGFCRTYVFATAATPEAILEAIRARRTVVYDRDGAAWGDPECIRLAAQNGTLRSREPVYPPDGSLNLASRIFGTAGLLFAIFSGYPGVYSAKEKEHQPK